MRTLPEQAEAYPYTALGYDLDTMCRNFVGYGGDIELANGVRFSNWSQQALAMRFLGGIQKHFGDWTINEITAYFFVINATVIGDLVGVKDVAAELGIPMSTASYVIQSLEQRNRLQAYQGGHDKRRKWLRMHPDVLRERIDEGKDIWIEQRQLLRQILEQDQIVG